MAYVRSPGPCQYLPSVYRTVPTPSAGAVRRASAHFSVALIGFNLLGFRILIQLRIIVLFYPLRAANGEL